MEVIIRGTSEEITALVLALQEQRIVEEHFNNKEQTRGMSEDSHKWDVSTSKELSAWASYMGLNKRRIDPDTKLPVSILSNLNLQSSYVGQERKEESEPDEKSRRYFASFEYWKANKDNLHESIIKPTRRTDEGIWYNKHGYCVGIDVHADEALLAGVNMYMQPEQPVS